MNQPITQWIARGSLIVAASSIPSCMHPSSPSERPISTSSSQMDVLAPTSRPMLKHWVQDAQLRAIMSDIGTKKESLREDSRDPEAFVDPLEKQSFDEAIVLADALALTAMQIPQLAASDGLNSDDRRGFNAVAKTLHD